MILRRLGVYFIPRAGFLVNGWTATGLVIPHAVANGSVNGKPQTTTSSTRR